MSNRKTGVVTKTAFLSLLIMFMTAPLAVSAPPDYTPNCSNSAVQKFFNSLWGLVETVGPIITGIALVLLAVVTLALAILIWTKAGKEVLTKFAMSLLLFVLAAVIVALITSFWVC